MFHGQCVPLREHIAELRAADERAITAALAAAEKAVDKAEAAQALRNIVSNEFRGTLSDQASRLMPRAEFESSMGRMNEKLSEVIVRLERSEGKGLGSREVVAYLFAIAAIGFSLYQALN